MRPKLRPWKLLDQAKSPQLGWLAMNQTKWYGLESNQQESIKMAQNWHESAKIGLTKSDDRTDTKESFNRIFTQSDL